MNSPYYSRFRILVAIAALFLLILAVALHQASDTQWFAVAKLEFLGAEVWHGDEGKRIVFTKHWRGSDQDVSLLQQVGAVSCVEIQSDRISDAGLQHVIQLKRLRSLWIETPSITVVGVQGLSRMEHLDNLIVTQPTVPEAVQTSLRIHFPDLAIFTTVHSFDLPSSPPLP